MYSDTASTFSLIITLLEWFAKVLAMGLLLLLSLLLLLLLQREAYMVAVNWNLSNKYIANL